MTAPRRLALLLSSALAACSGAVDDLPLGAEVTCSSTSDCPSGTVCQPSLGRCVSLSVDDRVAPGIVAGSASITPPSAAAGTLVTISFQVDEQLAVEPEVRLTGAATLLGTPRRNGLSYTLSFPVSPDDGEGLHQVEARLVDVAGNAAATVPIGSVTFDFTPPSAPPPLVTPDFARAGSTLTAVIVFSEPIDGTPTLQIDGGPTLTATPGPAASGFTFARTLDGSEPAGLVDLLLVARDPGGNELRRRYTGAAGLDFTSPSVASSSILTPALRAGDLFAAALRFDEPLGGPPTVLLVAPDASTHPVVASAVDASSYALSFNVPAATPDGTYALRLMEAADRAGNPVTAQQLGTVTVDSTPPAVSGSIALAPAKAAFRAGDQPALGFTASEELAGLPTARLETTPPVDAPCVAGTAARTFTCTLSRPLAATDLPEGTNALQVKLTDAAGNVGYGSRSLVLDYTPPALSGNAFTQLIPGSGNLRSTISALGPGSTIRVSLLAAEPLSADPVVRLVHPTSGQSLVLTRQSANGTSYVYTLTLDATVRPPATWALTWDPIDLAGNRWPATSLPQVGSVAVDGEAPVAPAVGTAAAPAITWERVPWGSEATLGAPRYTVAGSAASVPGAELVVAWDGPAASAREVGRSPVGPSGFGIPLGSDPAELYLSSVDGAGNESPHTRVVDVVWTAGLSGKVPGSSFENPHRLVRRSYSARALSQADDVEIAGTALGLQGDGHLITTSGTGLFRPVSGGSSPPARRDFSLAYDSARGRLVLYGGQILPAGSYPGDTWEWDGQAWRQVTPADPEGDGNPLTEGYWGMPMVADPIRGGVLLLASNLWLWNGVSWRKLDGGMAAPGHKYASSAAWDEARGVLVYFGGAYSNNTWEWNGSQWREVTPALPADSPAARAYQDMVYDTVRQRVMIFGGLTLSTGVQNDVWTWNGTRWTLLATAGTPPPARAAAAVAWDALREEMVVQGGSVSGGGKDGATWVLRWVSGVPTWFDVTPASGPMPLASHSAARDQASNRVVMVGDNTSGQLFAWDGSAHTWTLLAPGDPEGDGNPVLVSGRADIAYNTSRDRTVFVEGNLQQTWEWNRASWARLVNGAGPTQRTGHSIGSHGADVILFGGTASSSSLGDTWRWNGTAWVQLIASPSRPSAPLSNTPLLRQNAALVTDPGTGRLYRYGGADQYSGGIHCYSDLFEWTGAAWVQLGGDPGAWNDPEGDGSPSSGNGTADTCSPRGLTTWHPTRGSLLAYADWGNVIWEWLPGSNSWVRHAMTASSAFTARAFFYDSTLQAPVLLASDPWTSAPVGWVADLATNTFTPIATANIYGLSLPSGGLASFDPVLGKLVVVDLDSWTWEAGATATPAHLFHVDTSRANGPDPSACVDRASCPIQQIDVRWVGGGTAPTQNGAMLQAWTGDWLDAQGTTATAAAPAAITWSWTPASTFPASGLFHGSARELSFALVPRATTSAAGAAQVATDAVEVTVRYRRP